MNLSQFNKHLTVGKLKKLIKDYPNNAPLFVEEITFSGSSLASGRRTQLLDVSVHRGEYTNKHGEKTYAVVLSLTKGR